MFRSLFFLAASLAVVLSLGQVADAFTAVAFTKKAALTTTAGPLRMSDDFVQETPEDTKERIQALVDNHPVLVFMKGSKIFPQVRKGSTALAS